MMTKSDAAQLIGMFKPLDAAAYLRLRGWNLVEGVPDGHEIWTK